MADPVFNIFNILAAAVAVASLVMLAEFTAGRLVRRLRKQFQWLIVDVIDEAPLLDERVVNSFLEKSFDPELGWVRKPFEVGKERIKSAGESELASYPTSRYCMNAHGARHNPGHENLAASISTYGDSFAFSRQVDDDQTWQWHLSEQTGTNVLNWGVGNYGFDQALLRLKREYPTHPTDVVIMAFVPETLVRILSVWKHYFEYGNVLAFKPRYDCSGKEPALIASPARGRRDLLDLASTGRTAQQHDYWYEQKFNRDLLTFPYLFSLLQRPGRHLPLVTALILRELAGRRTSIRNKWLEDLPWLLTLKQNFRVARRLDDDPEALQTFEHILGQFLDYAQNQGFSPVCVLFPYLHDLVHWQKRGWYYPNLRRTLREKVATVDVAESLRSDPGVASYYVNDFYGGHLNARGNEQVGRIILDRLRELNIVREESTRRAA